MNPAPAGVKGDVRLRHVATPSNRPAPRIGVPFASIPLDVLRSRQISPAARLAFAALANHARMRRADVSTLTNSRLAESAGLSVAAVRRALDELEAAGLVRRLFGDSKRIRLATAITYTPSTPAEGCSTPATQVQGVAQKAQPGCAPAANGGCAPGAADLLRMEGEETRESVSVPSQEETEDPDAALFAILGPAAYLRMMMEKGKAETTEKASQQRQPAAPSPAPSPIASASLIASAHPPARTPELLPPLQPTSPPGSPTIPQDDAKRAISRWVGNLFKDARKAAWGPAPGKPRHLTQAEQLAALAERKRRREREARNGPGASNRPPNSPNVSTP